jgi:hypothetical protein
VRDKGGGEGKKHDSRKLYNIMKTQTILSLAIWLTWHMGGAGTTENGQLLGPLIITARSDEFVNFGHKLELSTLSRKLFDEELDSVTDYLVRTKERLDSTLEHIEDECEKKSCKDYNFQKVQETVSYYNGFQVDKITGTIKTAFTDCLSLPEPDTKDEISNIKDIMEAKGITTQPLHLQAKGNYLLYETGTMYSSQYESPAATTEASASGSAPSGGNPKPAEKRRTFAFVIKEGKFSMEMLNESTETEAIEFLCLGNKDDYKYNEAKAKDLIKKGQKGVERAIGLLKTWSLQLFRCHQTSNHEGEGKKISVTEQPIVKLIQELYFSVERRLGEEQLGVQDMMWLVGQVEKVKDVIKGMVQQANRCQIGKCKVEIGTVKLVALCRDSTQVRGTHLSGTPVPYEYHGEVRQLMYANYQFDYSFKNCRTHVDEVQLNLDPQCCRQLEQTTQVNKCPYFVVHNAPVYFEVGPSGYVVAPASTSITTQCGTTKDDYVVKPGEGIVTDCSMVLDKGQISLAVPGFGNNMYSNLVKRLEEAGHVWTEAELGLLTLGVIVILTVTSYIVCKCTCCFDCICNMLRCCSGKGCIVPTAPTERSQGTAFQERVRLFFD